MTKQVKAGFSWTFFFFGIWVPLFRGDFKNLFRIWGLSIITIGVYYFIACFTYNKTYIQGLLEKGYQPHDDKTRAYLIGNQIIAEPALAQTV
jgi:hypothetical protein